jgi:hypothetical protein
VFTDSNSSASKIRYYSNFIMVAFYLALGLLFLFTEIAIDIFPENRVPIGIVFICYGLFRTGMTIWKIKKLNQNK